jgi:hypothetical protein
MFPERYEQVLFGLMLSELMSMLVASAAEGAGAGAGRTFPEMLNLRQENREPFLQHLWFALGSSLQWLCVVKDYTARGYGPP